ncbi:hypothetical protein PPYR_12277 [Photinus pyralis]|uniref:PH domain-containing protein n=1 Tax=Photinus pyralis TaxID=7054 RepID=A0A1Y1LYT4_PHOPY|nr:pleckstrin homology domain-containing family A member 3-like [Photinus pyralis]KAB0795438.1 hypothetical protein PPYR_12277 [Photinus pyralis]
MEGVLWKWTNYWNGWQTRWFVLENGILTYYKSQEEVNKGSKGSIKVQACEIIVHTIDTTRLDLDIPGEQHLYLKAATPQERQGWLIALGTAKACVSNRSRKDTSDNIFYNSESEVDTLKSKKSELRLYCDLLMQQVHTVKTAANVEGGPEISKMDEATSLLTATCDTFIKTLEDCMKLSHSNVLYEITQHNDAIIPNIGVSKKRTILRPHSNDC